MILGLELLLKTSQYCCTARIQQVFYRTDCQPNIFKITKMDLVVPGVFHPCGVLARLFYDDLPSAELKLRFQEFLSQAAELHAFRKSDSYINSSAHSNPVQHSNPPSSSSATPLKPADYVCR